MDAPLYNQIRSMTQRGTYPMHMPGHKRNTDLVCDSLLELDITELDGSDNMHSPHGVILEAEELMAQLYGCDRSLFLVNGGSGGILASILGTLREGERIAVPSNAHKSVLNALVLSGAAPLYIYPDMLSGYVSGGITPAVLEKAFEAYPDIKAVLAVSPTYEGVVSDIAALAGIAHKNNALLIVDETHGAHFPFCSSFPQPAVRCGADISVNSWHKTLPCPGQSAVLNINTARLDLDRLFEAYSMVQTTSPSYIMMALMDKTRAFLKENDKYFYDYVTILTDIRNTLRRLKGVKLLEKSAFADIFDYDISKITLLTGKKLSGQALAQILLKEYNIQTELSDADRIIAMTSVADRHDKLAYFASALEKIDAGLEPYIPREAFCMPFEISVPVMTPRDVFYSHTVYVPLHDAQGRIAGESVSVFPPDIPLIFPGERISAEQILLTEQYRSEGACITGASGGRIKIEEEA